MILKVWVIFGFYFVFIIFTVLNMLFISCYLIAFIYINRENYFIEHWVCLQARKHWKEEKTNQRLTIKINKRTVYKWAILVRFFYRLSIQLNEWVEWRQSELFNIYIEYVNCRTLEFLSDFIYGECNIFPSASMLKNGSKWLTELLLVIWLMRFMPREFFFSISNKAFFSNKTSPLESVI